MRKVLALSLTFLLQVFDFNVDPEAEALLINGHALQLIPQRIRKITLLAVVIPPDHPALPEHAEPGSITTPEVIDALNKLERNGLVTADVDVFVVSEGDVRQIAIHVHVIEVEGKLVIHKDLLITQITLPEPHGHQGQYNHKDHHEDHEHRPHHRPSHPQVSGCSSSDWVCRFGSWVKSLTPGCGGMRPHGGPDRHHHDGPGNHRRPGDRHRFNPPRHGFMRFIVSVVIPVLIGAAVGVGIGILSVFIAEIVGGIIMRIRGRRNAQYMEVDRKDEDDENEEELPVYEELEETPAYPEEKQ